MDDPLSAPVRLVYDDGQVATLTVHQLFTFLLDAVEAVQAEDEAFNHPLLARLNDVVSAEAAPGTWAALLWCVGDALHRQ